MAKAKSKMSCDERRHDRTVRDLEHCLVQEGATCLTFTEYRSRERSGEIDLLAIYPTHTEFYEIKCNDNRSRYKTAKEQYRRFLNAFHLERGMVQGYMYCCDGTKREL